jgi:hypothetical protein
MPNVIHITMQSDFSSVLCTQVPSAINCTCNHDHSPEHHCVDHLSFPGGSADYQLLTQLMSKQVIRPVLWKV